MKIQPNEVKITGKWDSQNGRSINDEVCGRIDAVTRSHLKLLGRDPSGWNMLYLDPDDGRLWELTYPQSELHGGGPPSLCSLTPQEAKDKYGPIVPSQ